jgi:pimeloyl-ACP methyl ester carboxylesterase
MRKHILSFVLLIIGIPIWAGELIKFKAEDGLEVSAELYMPHPDTVPFLILFHQANSSRGEYLEIAPRLNALGYNCLAVDLRSGSEMNGVRNATKQSAIKGFKETNYINALPDMRAAIHFVHQQLAQGPIILLGSSYSASLSLVVAAELQEMVQGVIGMSPGEYFRNLGQSADYVEKAASHLHIPVLITSARSEADFWKNIFEAIPSPLKLSFLPATTGNHGARALWSRFSDAEAYWNAIHGFISSIPQ